MSFKWSQNFPYSQPRQIQAEALQTLEDNWDKYDVFVIQGPTAFGKTAVARTLINSLRSVSVITPTNLLVNQFIEEFPDTPTLSRLDSYYCDEWKRPCSMTRARLMKFCKGCKCSKELATAKYTKGPGIYNYHTYLAHKLFRDVLVVDEAHNLVPTIKDRLSLTIWQHDYKYPFNMWKPEQVTQWIESLPDNKKKHKKITFLREAASYKVPEYVFHRTRDWFNGKGTLRNEPEERDCIKLTPVDVSNAPALFWPKEVKKIVLMSATISFKDIEAMGLGRRRVCYIQCKSPIPRGSRPIIPMSILSVNRNTMQDSMPVIAQSIQELADKHKGEKGVIHVTYQLSLLLREHLAGDYRYMFHDRSNKSDVYHAFRNATDDRILVACGMYEGIDLPQDLGRWQVIAKIPWGSLGSPAIKHLAELDPEWYIWETLKTTIQACGRVCRTPEDYGVTYILDKSFWRMFYDGKHLLPQWFTEAIQYKRNS